MKDFVKKIVERLYYKCYPDRKNDHDIANMPIPIIREERYKPTTYQTVIHIPRELTPDVPPLDMIREQLARQLVTQLVNENEIEIRKDIDILSHNVRYIGYIRVLKRGTYREV